MSIDEKDVKCCVKCVVKEVVKSVKVNGNVVVAVNEAAL